MRRNDGKEKKVKLKNFNVSRAAAFLSLAVTALPLQGLAQMQSIPVPASAADSGARATVAIKPVDTSNLATKTEVNNVSNTANSAYWYGTNAYTNANNAYNLASTANNTANSAYWYGSTVYNSGRVVGNGEAMVSGDGGWQVMPGICVSGFPQHNPWAPRGRGTGGDPCPEGSGFVQTQFPSYTPP